MNLLATLFLTTPQLIAMKEENVWEENGSLFSSTIVNKDFSFISRDKPFSEEESRAKKQYPQYFSEMDQLDGISLENYRKSWLSYVGKHKDLFLTLHNATLLPLLSHAKQYLETYKKEYIQSQEIVRRFLREIEFYQGTECISPNWLDKLPFRFLSAVSTMNDPEKDFIAHLTEPYSSVFFTLQENEAWKNPETAHICMGLHRDRTLNLSSYEYSILPEEAIQDIIGRVEKALPLQTTYAMWGANELGIATIIKAMLNDTFLVSIPFKRLISHGTPLSSYGFSIHELFHKSIDHRRIKFIQHIIDFAEKYVAKGGSIQTFLDLFLPPTLIKYRGIMKGLQEIYERLICTFDQVESRKAILGFFWVLHEEPHFPSILYTVRNFDDILKIITEDEGDTPILSNTLDSKDKVTAGIDLKDPFETSSLDGSSKWKDKEIIEWVVKNKTIKEARKYELIKFVDGLDKKINKNDIVSQSVKRSSRYIDVTFIVRQGEKLTYSFQTLFYSMHATHDALKILELIGIESALPSFSNREDNPRELAQIFIKKGEETLSELISHFRKTASSFAHEDSSGEGNLIYRYSQAYDSLEKEVSIYLNKMKTKKN